MTIKYTLTRTEIVKFFLQSISRSPRLLVIILLIVSWPALIHNVIAGSLSKGLTIKDVISFCEWSAGAFVLIVFWVYLRAKVTERIMTTSEQGISTEIGSLKGEVTWDKISTVRNSAQYVLIVRSTGNAFFVPSHAFSGPEHQTQFVAEIDHWRNS